MPNSDPTERQFVARVLDLYLRLPQTPARVNRTDRQLAAQWHAQGVSWATLEAAFLLTTARRCLRDPALPPLPPIRSLHYFAPVLKEVQDTPLAPEYLRYLRGKLTALIQAN